MIAYQTNLILTLITLDNTIYLFNLLKKKKSTRIFHIQMIALGGKYLFI